MSWKLKHRLPISLYFFLGLILSLLLLFQPMNKSTKSAQPIRIEAEDYLAGSQGVSYYDSSSLNYGKAYRQDDVDIEATTDVGGGYNVGWIEEGEWLTYDLEIPVDATYQLIARVASEINSNHGLGISLDGKEIDRLNFKGTGAWQSWQDVTGKEIKLTAGKHQMRLDMQSSLFNINYIELIPVTSAQTGKTKNIRLQAEDYLTYSDFTSGNIGQAYRQDDVDIETTTDVGGGYNVGWIQEGESLNYDLEVTEEGIYKIVTRIASATNNARGIKFSLDGNNIGDVNFKGTGGWQTWQDVAGEEIYLTKGNHQLQLDLVGSEFNINYIDFEYVSPKTDNQPDPDPLPQDNGGNGNEPEPSPIPQDNGGNQPPSPSNPSVINADSVRMGAGGFVTGIVTHPQDANLIYARTDVGGLFRWDSTQQEWIQILSPDRVGQKVSPSVESIAIAPNAPNVIYAAVGAYTHKGNDEKAQVVNGQFLKSVDRGESWEVLDLSIPTGGNGEWRWTGERLSVDPNNSNVVYFGSRMNGLWTSQDGGKSWSQINTATIPVGDSFGEIKNLPGVTFVEFDPNSQVINGKTQTIYTGVAGKGIYRSTDGGQSWNLLTGGPASSLVPQQGEVVANGELVATFYDEKGNGQQGGIWKFNGSGWQNVTPSDGQNYAGLTVNENDPNILYTMAYPMTPNDIYRSTDGGDTWTALNNQLDGLDWWPEWSFWNLSGDLAVNPTNSNQVWLTNGIGVWKTEDGGAGQSTWSATVAGIEETVTFDAVSTPGGASLITAIADFNGFRHTDVDAFPTRNHSGGEFYTMTSIDYSAGNPNFLVAAAAHHDEPWKMYSGYSTDNGANWKRFASLENGTHPYELNFGNIAVSATDTNNIVWQPTNWVAPYFTKDGGATWTKISYFDQQFGGGGHTALWSSQEALAADSVMGGTFYLYHLQGGQIVRTQDGGATWTVANQNSLLPSGIWSGANVKTTPGVAGDVWVSLLDQGLYHSTDAGETFTKIEGIGTANDFGFGKAAPGSDDPTLFVQGEIDGQMGVFGSTDLGDTWTQVPDLPEQFISGVTTLTGDMNTFGRVYVGTAGNGFLYGDLN
jgi:photosystem II stability/assembly factor-like uncharacterized protein